MFNEALSSARVALTSASGGFNWYGFLIGSGMVLCIILAYFMAKRRGYYSDLVFDIAICCIPCAIVGARLYYIIFDVIANPDAHWSFKKIIGLEGGLAGLAIYGGLIGACLGALIVVAMQKKKPTYDRVTFIQMADLCFTVIILGQVIGRWGNFVNQEAYGNAVTDPSLQWFPYAVKIDAAHSITGKEGWFQATFFYESFWNLIGFGLLMLFYNGNRKSFDGFTFSFYCIWYGCGRFFIEGLRTDSLWLVPGVIRVSQVVSALIFLFGVAYVVTYICRARASGKKLLLFVPEENLSDEYYGYEKTEFYLRTLKPSPEEAKKEEDDGPQFDEVSDDDRYWEVGGAADDDFEDEVKTSENEAEAALTENTEAASGADSESTKNIPDENGDNDERE